MLGVYGGTFDPVHFGHLRTAFEVAETLGLERVHMIPCHVPPHRGEPTASPAQRRDMMALALAGQSRLVLDTRELDRPGPSYMVDTLASLRSEFGEDVPLCLILGRDALAGLPGWHRWRRLTELAHLVVMARPQAPGRLPADLEAHLAGREARDRRELAGAPAGRLLSCSVTQLDISSTHIRALLRGGRSPRYLLPDPVLDVILQQGLYRTERNGSSQNLS